MKQFNSIRIKLASHEAILSWSKGEVTKAETINYRTRKPEKDGLFCEKIFGPVKDYECGCGKYKGIKYQGLICERCKVEVTHSSVRRERMGHIKLGVPIAHIWFYKVMSSRIGTLLSITLNKLKRILYYESYVVIEPGNTELKASALLTEIEYKEIMETEPEGFVAEMGAGAIQKLLQKIDLDEISPELRAIMKIETAPDKRRAILKKLQIVEAFRTSGVRPEWMVLTVLPVIPPDLRPLVALEGGRYATSDLNDLYRRVITRNNRLNNLLTMRAPEIILRNEKRMLQEAVDALLDNARRARPVKGRGDRPLKALSDALKGKHGRFRENLLGKRVDYSGRSVIVVDPELKLHECGVPKIMALELFKPFLIKELEERGYAESLKVARRLLETGAKEVWDVLEKIVKSHPVLLNRAPTLHRLSIQAFMPVLIEGKAIRINPLVCAPFNADFDGDQMAIHVPISLEAQIESLILMLSSNNILSPAHGAPISVPSQDVIIGMYWLTKEKQGEKGEGKIFGSPEEVEFALENSIVGYHARIRYKLKAKNKMIDTTVGRVIFNDILPVKKGFVNYVVDKKKLIELVSEIYAEFGNKRAVQFLDDVKVLGFKYATLSGLTIGIDDMVVPENKQAIIDDTFKEVSGIHKEYERGVLTESERYNTVIDVWTTATQRVEKESLQTLAKDRQGFNPLYTMAISGARGNMDQVRQIIGTRGLMTKPQKGAGKTGGEIIETPINSSFKEGLSVLEYFISTHGARKGLTDTALKTAQAGYLTRKLVDVAQDVMITESDCGTIMGIDVTPIKEGEEIIESISERVKGRHALEDIINPLTSRVIIYGGQEITDEKAKEIEECGIQKVRIRSVLTCETPNGLCQKCYGRNLGTGKLVETGEAVGVVAAQSIGEPGTQLTLRTFHIGGIATRIAKESEVKVPYDSKVKFDGLHLCTRRDGRNVCMRKAGKIILKSEKSTITYKVPYGATVKVQNNQQVSEGDLLFEWDPYSFVLLADKNGKVKFSGLEENVTYRLEYDERTGQKRPVTIKHKKIHPIIELYENSTKVTSYPLPVGAYIFIKEGAELSIGDILAKVPGEITKTRDITGGLPRVIELFEARVPGDAAILTEVDGVVYFVKSEKGIRTIEVKGESETRKYKIPYARHLAVEDGTKVKAGDNLCEGPVDPHKILEIKGVQAVQEYLVNQIQEVYRLQGVKINDKHIGIIVEQMLSKVKIEDPGDTIFVEGQIIEKIKAKEENESTVQEGGKSATFQPILLGISRTILTTESFIAAASFQETTRVLTDAAIQGKKDSLLGVKENLIMGNLIPVGTGFRKYHKEDKSELSD